MKMLLVAINAKYIHSNLAVYDLRAYAGEYRQDIEIAEYTINNLTEHIIMDIYKRKPEVLAFSTYIWNVELVHEVAHELHKLLPEIDIWLGGPEVSYDSYELLKKYEYIKGVMRGEGEETFRLLMKHYKDGMELEKVTGVTYREQADGVEAIKTNPDTAAVNMDDIPFPYDDITDFENRIIYYESSRGCPYSCSYCLSSVDKRLRFRSVELVRKELLFFLEKKVAQVKFVDRTFNCLKAHALTIWQFILENDNGITNFHFEISADILDKDMLEVIGKMRPGLIQLEIGVQTTNETTIKEIRRTMNFDRLAEVVKALKANRNVHLHLDLIAGLPFENMDSFINSFNEVYALQPDELQLGFLKVLKGSYMKEKHKDYGIVHKDKAPYEVMYTSWLSFPELLRLKQIEEMVEIFYNSNQFAATIAYLENKYETPYKLYEALADYYEFNVGAGSKQSRMARYELLHAMYEKETWINELDSLLAYDIFLREKAKSRPSFKPLTLEDKEAVRMLYRNEFREYDGKMTHIEPFEYEITGCHNGSLTNKKVYILFDYSRRNPLDYSAATTVLVKE